MPRAQKESGKPRHDPLHVQLGEDQLHAKYDKISQPGHRRKSRKNDHENSDEVILDPKTSQRIFELARDQQAELDGSDEADDDDLQDQSDDAFTRPRVPRHSVHDEDEDGSDEDSDDREAYGAHAEDDMGVDESDMQALDSLLPPNASERKTLADLIFAKLDGNETSHVFVVGSAVQQDPSRPDPALGLDPRVVEVYTTVGQYMSKNKNGKLPKPLKVLPGLPGWARLLALTEPENWTANAVHAAVKTFIPSMKPAQAQLFLRVVLLEAIRADIAENKTLKYHYYEALRRALFKPAAVFKGVIFPLLETGCTLKEATIVASVLAKKHIPVLQSAAALMRIAEMDYSGANSLFIRVLIDKKHELPYQVIDALVFHFIRLSNTYKAKSRGDPARLPVLWHQSLLSFVQRYASDLTPDQKEALLDVVRAHPHAQIGSEVRRELVNSVVRGAPRPDADVEMS